MIAVPYYNQDTSYNCGPAALQMVFAHYGFHFSEGELARRLKTKKETGTRNYRLAKMARREGFITKTKSGASLNQIKQYLDRDIPVIVNFIEPSHNDYHFAVVVGLTNGDVVLNDPWNGEKFTLPKKEFIKSWRSGERNHTHWLLALWPKED